MKITLNKQEYFVENLCATERFVRFTFYGKDDIIRSNTGYVLVFRCYDRKYSVEGTSISVTQEDPYIRLQTVKLYYDQ